MSIVKEPLLIFNMHGMTETLPETSSVFVLMPRLVQQNWVLYSLLML